MTIKRTPSVIGPTDPDVARKLQSNLKQAAIIANGRPTVSNSELILPSTTARTTASSVTLNTSANNQPGDTVTVYPSSGNVYVSTIDQTIQQTVVNQTGVYSIIAGNNVTISSTGVGGTGNVTINALGGGGGNADIGSWVFNGNDATVDNSGYPHLWGGPSGGPEFSYLEEAGNLNSYSQTMYINSPEGFVVSLDYGNAEFNFAVNGNAYFPGNIIVDVAGDANISSDANINIDAAGSIWTFSTDGNTTFPAVGTANLGNLAVANNFSTTGTGGDITLTGGNITGANVITANTFLGTGNLHLQPDPANSGSYLDIFLSYGPDLHLVATNANLILGEDDGANVMVSPDGNVSIQANTSTPHTWTFGSDGNLTLPNGAVIKDTVNAAVAFGDGAGANTQGAYSVAVGSGTGANTQGVYAVAVGNDAGANTQGNLAVAIGYNAGNATQGLQAVAVGAGAGQNTQGNNSVAIGYSAGVNTQGEASIAIGQNAGNTTQGNSAVAIGVYAGQTGQGDEAVAIGDSAGQTGQKEDAVAIGQNAGQTNQGISSVAIGYGAGLTDQGNQSVAIGENAGANQGSTAVAIGQNAGGGVAHQNDDAVAIGHSAGEEDQGTQAIAIGLYAGQVAQGLNSIALGAYAGQTSQGNNSIILNATGAALNQTTANTFTVSPVRNDVANIAEVIFYNTTSKEVTYGNTISIAGNITAGNISGTYLVSTNAAGNEGGEISLAKPPNGTLTGGITIDAYQNTVRFFEQGGTARGLSVDIANTPAGGGTAIGYRDIPQVAAGNVTLSASDAGKHYYSTSAGNFTLTIPLNSSVPFNTGTAISIVVQSAGNVLVNAASGVTLYMAGNSTAANRVVSNYGMSTLLKVATDTWMINGTGVA